jgi:hypothetical protein
VTVLDAVDKRKSFYLCKESNSDRDMAAVSNKLCVMFEAIFRLLRETEARWRETRGSLASY